MPGAIIHVLIADDEKPICKLISDQLALSGYQCTCIHDAEQARHWLDTGSFDLLISDISMPRISGLELLSIAKRRHPDCKVILMTGHRNRKYLAQALLLGADDYLEKPFTMSELLRIVKDVARSEDDMPKLSVRAAEALQFHTRAEQVSLQSVRALVRAVEAKDPYTRRHSEQVAHYAARIADLLNLSAAEMETVRVAALLHDVGKIGVPDHVLCKHGPLTDEEFDHIRRHPSMGADILSNITLFQNESEIVRGHHEAFNGRGYPHGLAGEEIPLGARIINVADSMDAMLMARTYKDAYPVELMLSELERCRGTQFDPDLAELAHRHFSTHREDLILPPAETDKTDTARGSAVA